MRTPRWADRSVRGLLLAGAVVATFGLASCSGDGQVVLPSDTTPKPPATTAQHLTCDQIRATATTVRKADGSVVIPLIVCSGS